MSDSTLPSSTYRDLLRIASKSPSIPAEYRPLLFSAVVETYSGQTLQQRYREAICSVSKPLPESPADRDLVGLVMRRLELRQFDLGIDRLPCEKTVRNILAERKSVKSRKLPHSPVPAPYDGQHRSTSASTA